MPRRKMTTGVRQGRPRAGAPRVAAGQHATIEAVLGELERTQHAKVVLEHLAVLLLSEFTGVGDAPPRIKIGVDDVGAIPARDDVLDEVHEMLVAALKDAEKRQRALLDSKVIVSVRVPPRSPESLPIAPLSTTSIDSPSPPVAGPPSRRSIV